MRTTTKSTTKIAITLGVVGLVIAAAGFAGILTYQKRNILPLRSLYRVVPGYTTPGYGTPGYILNAAPAPTVTNKKPSAPTPSVAPRPDSAPLPTGIKR